MALSVTESVPDSIIAPYCVLLLVPLMSRMSDSNVEVRTAATKAFAALVPLLPLARGSAPPANSLPRKRNEARRRAFWKLYSQHKIDNFELPFKCKYQLCPYQRDGVNWFAAPIQTPRRFMRRYGIRQNVAIDVYFASSTVERRAKGLPIMPHLIICPPTLVGHWAHESACTRKTQIYSPCANIKVRRRKDKRYRTMRA